MKDDRCGQSTLARLLLQVPVRCFGMRFFAPRLASWWYVAYSYLYDTGER
jgi:hypothetical protein